MTRIVQTFSASVFLATVLALAGCGGEQEQTAEEEMPDTGRFGNAYQIVTNESPAAPDEPPAILSDSLTVMVAYPGGCADHEFELGSNVSGDSAEVWLRHDSGGDNCEAQITERVQFALPQQVLSAREIHLLNPHADVPFMLRWNASAARNALRTAAGALDADTSSSAIDTAQ